MKEKKSMKKADMIETETTGFEKFEKEAKTTIFNVLYVLLKDDETSHWKHIVLIFIDYFQIWYFPFAPQFHFPWESEEAMHYFETFLDFFQVHYWVGKLDYTTYLIFFYIIIFIVCLVILDIIYVSISFSRRKFTFVWPLQALRSICGLFVTVLFLPFLESFLSMITCVHEEGHYSMELFPEIHCWSGSHIIHATIACIVSLVFIIICVVVSLTYFDSSSNSQELMAKINARADVFVVILKIILSLTLIFLPQHEYNWLQIALLLILSSIAFGNYRNNWPYFNDKMNKFFAALTGILLWSSFNVLIIKILQDTEFNGGLQIFFLGLPLVLGVIIFNKDERIELLMLNLNNFQKGETAALQIRYFLNLVKTQDQDRKNAITLKGYIYYHEESCTHEDCQLKMYKQAISKQTKTKKNAKGFNEGQKSLDHQQLLLLHAKNLYKHAIAKFPLCTSLKIQYAFFLMERLKKKADAIVELTNASQYNPPFDEQFIIYRYKKMSEDYGDLSEGSHEGLDVVAKFAYESSLRQCQQYIERSSKLHLEFWNYLREDRPDISKLNECGSRINQSILMVEQYWNQAQKLNPNQPQALKLYAKFLINILNDKEAGQELLSRAKDQTNVKANFFDNNNAVEDISDSNFISSNGTPCIYVHGDNDRLGILSQCNLGASRIFGYLPNELRNVRMERLMPEMYAIHHNKILDDSLQKGPENIPNKERIVFARHKSGYVFPVWLQIKMVQTMSMGVQFIALFKIDRKLISSNIAYILLNKEKKIQALSSSCMKLLNIDLQKMRKLNHQGVDIHTLAPALFKDQGQEYYNKQGGLLEWHCIDLEKAQKQRNPESSWKNVHIPKRLIHLTCHLNSITMGEQGEIGWYIKLEKAEQMPRVANQASKIKDKVKFPLFQFRYEQRKGSFIREVRSTDYVDIGNKDPHFQNGEWRQNVEKATTLRQESMNSEIQNEIQKQEESKEKLKNEPQMEDVIERRKNWSKNINTYVLVNGTFQHKNYEEELRKQKELEEQQQKKLEEEDKEEGHDKAFKNNIKSRRALAAAINDKSVPSAIRNLKMTMNMVILALLVISIVEYTVINRQFKDINENFNLIQKAYGRISEIQRIMYDVRTLLLLNNGTLSSIQNYTTSNDYVSFFQNDIQSSLESLYTYQNEIDLSYLDMSPVNDVLMHNKTTVLYFKQFNEDAKEIKFTLSEAVLQFSSAVFTVRHFDLKNYTEDQEDIYFISYNAFNDFLEHLRISAINYVDDLFLRSEQKKKLILILFLSSLVVNILAIIILFPFVSNVNLARIKILTLFVDIPNHHVINLSLKCENFITSIEEELNEEMESNEDGRGSEGIDDTDMIKFTANKRNLSKTPINAKASSSQFFIQFGIAVLIIIAYFIIAYVLARDFLKHAQIIGKEMNVLAQGESYYALAQNVQREMIVDPTKLILNQDSFKISRDTNLQLHMLNEQILNSHLESINYLASNYITDFDNTYKGNLCTDGNIEHSLIPFSCDTYLSGTPKYVINIVIKLSLQGLQSLLIRYFETLKETLKQYVQYKEQGLNTKSMLNIPIFQELYIIQARYIQKSFRYLVEMLSDGINSSYQGTINTRLGAFIVFIVVLIIGYLALWIPFVSKLNKDIWRTKQMLTIIPIEVILKIPRISEFLHNQSYFNSKSSQ